MSGNRDHLSDLIKKELESTLTLVLKNLGQGTVDLDLPAHTVYFETQIQNPVYKANPTVSRPWTRNGLKPVPSVSYPVPLHLSPPNVQRHECRLESVVEYEACFTSENARLHSVLFDNLNSPPARPWRIQPTLPPQGKALTGWEAPKTIGHQALDFEISATAPSKSKPVQAFKSKSKVIPPKLWGLPITRSPIPPHRFSANLKQSFRKFLADKAQTSPANIQLRIVFDRMHMGLFSSIGQDERGQLLCHPKAELLGRSEKKIPEQAPTYLVIGTRTDTGEDVKALIPMEEVQDD